MSWTSIRAAHAYWCVNNGRSDPPSDLDEAEVFILSWPPTNAQEAVCILDVICFAGGDVRCDGLDRAAFGRIRDYLSNVAEPDLVQRRSQGYAEGEFDAR